MFTRTFTKTQYTHNGSYITWLQAAQLRLNGADVVEYPTVIAVQHSKTLKGFAALGEPELNILDADYESVDVTITRQ